jgi:hypothetical protein
MTGRPTSLASLTRLVCRRPRVVVNLVQPDQFIGRYVGVANPRLDQGFLARLPQHFVRVGVVVSSLSHSHTCFSL